MSEKTVSPCFALFNTWYHEIGYPSGKVMVGNEIWDAVSVDGLNLNIGDEVTIRNVEGLQVVVEKTPVKISVGKWAIE